MKKPVFNPAIFLNRRILWDETFGKLYQLFCDPSPIRPQPADQDLLAAFGCGTRLKRALPQLRGGVYHTMQQVVTLFINQWNRAKRSINLSVRTNYASLAKRCRKRDPQTAYFHVLALVEHGFLRAKVRLSHGIELLINPELIVFAGPAPIVPLTAAARAKPTATTPAAIPLPERSDLVRELEKMARGLMEKFSAEPDLRT